MIRIDAKKFIYYARLMEMKTVAGIKESRNIRHIRSMDIKMAAGTEELRVHHKLEITFSLEILISSCAVQI